MPVAVAFAASRVERTQTDGCILAELVLAGPGIEERIWTDGDLRAEYSKRCLERAPVFTWRRCAEETLAVLNSLR